MSNVFSEIEEEVLFNEDICFDELKIKDFIFNFLENKINLVEGPKRGFYFEKVILEFFEYMNLKVLKTPKTRDFGLDGIINFELGFLGNVDIGLQIKYKLIGSGEVDSFLGSLKNSELQLGVLVCKDSRELQNYELNSKLKAILLSRGFSIKEKLIKDKINLNPVFVLKFEEVGGIVASQIRAFVMGVYKK